MDRLEAMQLFVRVSELGSFAEVALQLGVARSVVTRKIAQLEAHLGVKLLARSTRSLTLTSAGSEYLEHCRIILNLVEGVEADLAQGRAVPKGRIRISVPLSYGLRRLTPLLIRFTQHYPAVSIEIDYDDQRVDLIERGFDLSIRVTDKLAGGDIARLLDRCEMHTVASPDYLARHGEPMHPEEILKHACLGYNVRGGNMRWKFLVDGQILQLQTPARFSANNGDALMAAAVAGMGLTSQPDFITHRYLESGQVRRILVRHDPPALGVYAMLPGNRHIPMRVRVLIDTLADWLREPSTP